MRLLLMFAALLAASCGFRIEPPALPLVVNLDASEMAVVRHLDAIN